MKKVFFIITFFGCNSIYCQGDTAFSFHQGAEHTGVYSSKNYSSFGNLLLKFRTGGKIFSSPLINKGVAYIGSEDGNLYAINTGSKELVWKFSTRGAIHSSPALFRQVVFFGSYDGYFYAVERISGKLKWKFKMEGEKKAGAKGLWTMKPVTEYMEDPFDFFLSSPSIDAKDSLVYFGSGDGTVYALHTNNGKLL